MAMRNRAVLDLLEIPFEHVDGGHLRLKEMEKPAAVVVFLRYVG